MPASPHSRHRPQAPHRATVCPHWPPSLPPSAATTHRTLACTWQSGFVAWAGRDVTRAKNSRALRACPVYGLNCTRMRLICFSCILPLVLAAACCCCSCCRSRCGASTGPAGGGGGRRAVVSGGGGADDPPSQPARSLQACPHSPSADGGTRGSSRSPPAVFGRGLELWSRLRALCCQNLNRLEDWAKLGQRGVL